MINKIDLSLKTRKTTEKLHYVQKIVILCLNLPLRILDVSHELWVWIFFFFDPNNANFCNCVVHNDKGPKTIILVHLSLMIAHALLNLTKRIVYNELVRRLHYKLLLYLHQKILDLNKILIVLRGLLYFTGMKLKNKTY